MLNNSFYKNRSYRSTEHTNLNESNTAQFCWVCSWAPKHCTSVYIYMLISLFKHHYIFIANIPSTDNNCKYMLIIVNIRADLYKMMFFVDFESSGRMFPSWTWRLIQTQDYIIWCCSYLCVALWIFPRRLRVLVFLSHVYQSLWSHRLGKSGLVCMFHVYLFVYFVWVTLCRLFFCFSWCHVLAAVCDCDAPWTFHLTFLLLTRLRDAGVDTVSPRSAIWILFCIIVNTTLYRPGTNGFLKTLVKILIRLFSETQMVWDKQSSYNWAAAWGSIRS